MVRRKRRPRKMRRKSRLRLTSHLGSGGWAGRRGGGLFDRLLGSFDHVADAAHRSEEHTSELQSLRHLVCRLLLEKKIKYPARNKRARVAMAMPDLAHVDRQR